jgi:hypothetical protein
VFVVFPPRLPGPEIVARTVSVGIATVEEAIVVTATAATAVVEIEEEADVVVTAVPEAVAPAYSETVEY